MLCRLVEASLDVKYFWIDDIWVTGYLAAKVGIEHLNMVRYWTTSMEQMLLMKSLQNPSLFHHDFVSGPMFRDYKIAMAMEQRAKWCYMHQCKNNIYNPAHDISEDELENDKALLKLMKVRHKTDLLFNIVN